MEVLSAGANPTWDSKGRTLGESSEASMKSFKWWVGVSEAQGHSRSRAHLSRGLEGQENSMMFGDGKDLQTVQCYCTPNFKAGNEKTWSWRDSVLVSLPGWEMRASSHRTMIILKNFWPGKWHDEIYIWKHCWLTCDRCMGEKERKSSQEVGKTVVQEREGEVLNKDSRQWNQSSDSQSIVLHPHDGILFSNKRNIY